MEENGYANFAELHQNEQENSDYSIISYHRKPEIAILAIHGGNIEPGTSEVATILGERLNASTYLFEGLKRRDNGKLHITSTAFDEPIAILMANTANTILSIHGYRSSHEELVYIGGKNQLYKQLIQIALNDAGFQTADAPPHLLGMNEFNITNRCKTGAGVQLELSRKLRNRFFLNDDPRSKNRHNQTETLNRFVGALEEATMEYRKAILDVL
ncbi:poly-gamma-glutamate hydrolase family protein [Peribacillus sp. NPDC097675]|uniref:poly-gamma-glutamate hydrolase family protein n=1 Tax=Peribacillus sp. NPDC097675 TaxID=3390618 RepID=UPI003CFCBD7E